MARATWMPGFGVEAVEGGVGGPSLEGVEEEGQAQAPGVEGGGEDLEGAPQPDPTGMEPFQIGKRPKPLTVDCYGSLSPASDRAA